MAETTCDQCGKPLRLYPSRFKRSDHLFCSQSCRGRYQSARASVTRPCLKCSKPVSMAQSIASVRRPICSPECRKALRVWPHGTMKSYRNGCRCNECKRANAYCHREWQYRKYGIPEHAGRNEKYQFDLQEST